MISYAQNFEDVMLARVFEGRHEGFYVDVGAADPVNLSVTKWFYDLGWRGINIEPNKVLFDRLAEGRPRDINIACGVGADFSEAQFFEFEVGELSTFDLGSRSRVNAPAILGGSRTVPVVPLTHLLDEHHKDQQIDFLKIDVEGWEHEVLKGLDLKAYRPVVLLIESTFPQSTNPSHAQWEPLVLSADFSFVYFDGVNRFYLANEHIHLKKHFSCPPNVFDDFELFPAVRLRRDAEERLKSIGIIEGLLAASEADRAARLERINELNARLIEFDGRFDANKQSIKQLEALLLEANQDRAARLTQIYELGTSLSESEQDRAARLAQIHELTARLSEIEQDSVALLSQIHKLEALLSEANQDRSAYSNQVHELERRLSEAERNGTARLDQIHNLTAHLSEIEQNSVAQLDQIQELKAQLSEAEETRVAYLIQIEKTERHLAKVENDHASALTNISNLNALLSEVATDRTALLSQNQMLETQLQDARNIIAKIVESRLWKITHPKWLGVSAGTQNMKSETSLEAADPRLRTIAVDLTPVLPGGENGGAKVFVLELIQRLAELAPQTQFVLLTRASSHTELAALDRKNIRRVLVAGSESPDDLRFKVVKRLLQILRHLPNRLQPLASRGGYTVLKAFRRSQSGSILRQLHADLLFCPFTAPTYSEPATPTVCVIYDMQYKTYPEFFAAEDVFHRDRTFVEACKRSTLLTAISDYSRDAAIAHGASEAKIKSIPLHISQHNLLGAEKDVTVLGRLAVSPRRYLIYPANFWKHKNHEMLLTAFGMARNAGLPGDIKLICTGAPGERQLFLRQAAEGLGLGDHVLFPGYLTHSELLALMTNSAGLIFPSLYEGFGLPVVEAMAIGVPVACSNVTSLPEVAGDAAILFDPRLPEALSHAMVTLVNDPELLKRMVPAGKMQAAKFSDSVTLARQYWDVFQQATRVSIHEDLLFGAHPDGWAGPAMTLQIAASAEARTLEIEIALPEWAPIPKVELKCYRKYQSQKEITVLPGQSEKISISLPSDGGFYDVELAPCFVPALNKLGDDQRELSAMLVKCAIVGSDGESKSLFPDKSAI